MDIFGAIKKLRDMGGQAIQGATQLGQQAAVGLSKNPFPAAGLAKNIVPVSANMAQNIGRMMGGGQGITPAQPDVNFNPRGRGMQVPATMPQIQAIRTQPQTSFLDLYNEMQPGGGLGNVQNGYNLNRNDSPTMGVPDWVNTNTRGYDMPATSGGNLNGIDFSPQGYSMPATMPELPIYLKRR